MPGSSFTSQEGEETGNTACSVATQPGGRRPQLAAASKQADAAAVHTCRRIMVGYVSKQAPLSGEGRSLSFPYSLVRLSERRV